MPIPNGIKAIELIGDRSINVAVPLYKKQVDSWLGDINSQMKDYDDFKKLKLTPISNEIKNTIERTLLLTYLMGNGFAEEDKEKLEILEKRAKFTLDILSGNKIESIYNFAIITGVNWRIVGFELARKLLAAKEVIPAAVFKAASAYIKSIAFSVQSIEDLNAILLIKKSLKMSIDNGYVFRDWVNMTLPELFQKNGYLRTPSLTPHHLETVFRTNQSSVYNSARYENFMRDRNIEAIEYLAIVDDRTRPEHESLDGFIAPKDDPVWFQIYPPNGYGCRCSAGPVSVYGLKTGNQKISIIDDKVRGGISGVHSDFTGKQNLLNIDKRIKGLIPDKLEEIANITF